MNAPLFISKRILKINKNDYSGNIVKIAIGTIALGVIVMLFAVFIVTGFKNQIEKKVAGFVGHLRVSNFDYNESWESKPIEIDQEYIDNISNLKHIHSVNQYALKAGILKTREDIEGIVFKGIGEDFDFENFSGEILEGRIPKYSQERNNDSILISKNIADKLNLSIDEKIDAYFLYDQTPRVRRFIISGIYSSGFGDYDKTFIISDINIIRQLNNWTNEQCAGYEIYLNSISNIYSACDEILPFVPYNCQLQTVYDINPQVFDWLSLQDVNVAVLLSIMSIVCIVTMISVLIIIIIEKTSMIGILKSLGMNNSGIRKIFMVKAAYIIGIGVLLGNVIALILSYIQIKFSIIKLPQESYYVNTVPIEINFWQVISIDLGIFLICMLIVIIPTALIAKVNPVNAIRYE
ncbi:ABC transporter permease [Bacteroidales bacterium OttesenSCG-928-K03]|nr:ABC transporter permease [Odoribacter sp. OttesenSCG-928-L07]MDL2239286.1 ABC transporter permease [Bacteroidales bacterium OttesenSCG-928-L14]MDL2240673.1 ABC transporter permease [Bacteroidales bacterium OttesenSCG-928-K22]MDL2242808.1 ABC transporter permease [Bacteroidales bacterium OttesenSCG-928-K03]